MTGADLIDLGLSLAALFGLWRLARLIAARDAREALNRRFLIALRIGMLLFLGRALHGLTGWEAFAVLIRLAAALIPLGAVILAEGLLRRHAPRGVKWLTGAGSLAFGLLAFWPGAPGLDWRDLSLMGYQLAGFLAAGAMILGRDRASLSPAENRSAVRLGLSLVLLAPMAAADFLALRLGLPVQVSGLAVLVLCWLVLSLLRAETGHGRALAQIGGIALAAVLAALAIWGALDLALRDALMAGLAILAALLAVAVAEGSGAARQEAESFGLLQLMATAPDPSHALRAHPLAAEAEVLTAAELDDLDPGVLSRLAETPLWRRGAGLPPGVEGDHLAHLFDRFGASHLVFLGRAPPRLLALSLPALSASPRLDLELAALARLVRAEEARGGA